MQHNCRESAAQGARVQYPTSFATCGDSTGAFEDAGDALPLPPLLSRCRTSSPPTVIPPLNDNWHNFRARIWLGSAKARAHSKHTRESDREEGTREHAQGQQKFKREGRNRVKQSGDQDGGRIRDGTYICQVLRVLWWLPAPIGRGLGAQRRRCSRITRRRRLFSVGGITG